MCLLSWEATNNRIAMSQHRITCVSRPRAVCGLQRRLRQPANSSATDSRSGCLRSFLLVLVSLTLAGCQGDDDSQGESALSFEGTSLRLVVPSQMGFEESLRPVLEEWSAQTGAEVQLTAVDYRNRRPAAGAGEVYILPLTQLAAWEQEQIIGPFSEPERAERTLGWSQVTKGLRRTIGSRNGRPTVVPVSCPPLVCYYRRDLLEAAELEPPATWEEYADLVRTQNEWADGLEIVEPWSESFRATLFLARSLAYVKHAESYSVFFDLVDGRPLIGTPGFERGLRDSLEILELLPAEVRELTPEQCRQRVLSGRAAMAIGYECGAARTSVPFGSSDAASDVVNERQDRDWELGMVPLPGSRTVFNQTRAAWQSLEPNELNRPVLCGFGGLVVAAADGLESTAAIAATHLVARIAVDEIGIAFPDGTRTLTRRDQLEQSVGWVGRDLKPTERQRYLEELQRQLSNDQIVLELAVVGRAEFREAVTQMLTQLIENGEPESAAAGLKRLQESWEAIGERVGWEAVRKSYRRTIGLELQR